MSDPIFRYDPDRIGITLLRRARPQEVGQLQQIIADARVFSDWMQSAQSDIHARREITMPQTRRARADRLDRLERASLLLGLDHPTGFSNAADRLEAGLVFYSEMDVEHGNGAMLLGDMVAGSVRLRARIAICCSFPRSTRLIHRSGRLTLPWVVDRWGRSAATPRYAHDDGIVVPVSNVAEEEAAERRRKMYVAAIERLCAELIAVAPDSQPAITLFEWGSAFDALPFGARVPLHEAYAVARQLGRYGADGNHAIALSASNPVQIDELWIEQAEAYAALAQEQPPDSDVLDYRPDHLADGLPAEGAGPTPASDRRMPSADGSLPKVENAPVDSDKIAHAIALRVMHPEWSDTDVRTAAGIKHGSTLTRDRRYQRAKETVAGRLPPRGVKTKGGDVE